MRVLLYVQTVYTQGTLPAASHTAHTSACDHTPTEHSLQVRPYTLYIGTHSQHLVEATKNKSNNGWQQIKWRNVDGKWETKKIE